MAGSRRAKYDSPCVRKDPPEKVYKRPKGKLGENPVTSDWEYTDDEVEFGFAVEAWKRRHHRQFPSCAELLAIAKSLGYEKVAAAVPVPVRRGHR